MHYSTNRERHTWEQNQVASTLHKNYQISLEWEAKTTFTLTILKPIIVLLMMKSKQNIRR